MQKGWQPTRYMCVPMHSTRTHGVHIHTGQCARSECRRFARCIRCSKREIQVTESCALRTHAHTGTSGRWRTKLCSQQSESPDQLYPSPRSDCGRVKLVPGRQQVFREAHTHARPGHPAGIAVDVSARRCKYALSSPGLTTCTLTAFPQIPLPSFN